jgi:regulator of protease activity HflC (stomatin/prohibitin superfamily)
VCSSDLVEDYKQSLYRETQLALRAAVGTVEIDALLADRDSLVETVRRLLSLRAVEFGLTVVGFGIRDIILPGDMKELFNKVVESKKVAEANLITRREETAAMRSQANSAKLLADNPALMRLKELELLEKVATSSSLNILCGDAGLKDAVMKLI